MAKDKIITEVDLLKEHLKPFDEKSKNDFEWIEPMINHFCDGYSNSRDFIRNININIGLLKGKGISNDDLEDYIRSRQSDFDIELAHEAVPNYDIVGAIAKHMVGHQRRQMLRPEVIDTSPSEGNERKRFVLEQIQGWLQENVITRYHEQATMNVLGRHGIEDAFQMSPEEQMEMQFEVEEEFKSMTPSRLEDYMRNDYASPNSKLLTGLRDWLLREYDIKKITDDNFAISLATAMQVYYTGIRGDQLIFEPVDVRNFRYGDYPTCDWIQDGLWWAYSQDLPAVEIIARYGTELTDDECLEMTKVAGSYKRYDYLENMRLISEVRDGELDHINMRTTEGLRDLQRVKDKYGVGMNTNMFEVSHVAFKTIDRAKFVVRFDGRKKRGFYVSSDYERKPGLDIEVKDVRIPIIMEGTRINIGGEHIFVQKGPLPYANRSIENPFKVTGPYVGAVYDKMLGMGEIVSQIDLGKPFQYEYNQVKAKMEEDRATDYGKILPILLKLKPADWTLDEWLTSIKRDKFLIIGEQSYENGQISASELQLLRDINLSNIDKIQSRLNELEAIRQSAMRAMGYNDNILGQSSPYQSQANHQSNVNLSLNQTETIFSTHNKIVEKALTHFMQNAIIYIKDKPIQSSTILDDLSRAVLDLDFSSVHFVNVGVFISNSNRDGEMLNLVKSRIEPLGQTGALDEESYIKLLTSNSLSEILNILRENRRRREEAEQAAAQREAEAYERQREELREREEREYQFELDKIDRKGIITLNAAELNAQTLERANDVNRNQINDANERQEKQLRFNREKLASEDRHKDADREIERIELEIKRMQASKSRN